MKSDGMYIRLNFRRKGPSIREGETEEVINLMKNLRNCESLLRGRLVTTERGGSPFDGCNSTPNKSIDNEEFLM